MFDLDLSATGAVFSDVSVDLLSNTNSFGLDFSEFDLDQCVVDMESVVKDEFGE